MSLYDALVTLLVLAVVLNLLNNLRRFHPPPLQGDLPASPPLISVLIPARDEQRNIGKCLNSLLQQDYPHMEILVLDDDSSDATAAIVAGIAHRDKRVRLLQGLPLPPGWHGKAFACHQLSEQARGEWLLFTDADTVHQPGAVSSSLRAALGERADLLSYVPRLVTGTFWEKVLIPIIAFFPLFLLPLGWITDSPDPRISMALGPFLFFRAPFYRRIGGHQAVRQEIAEDMAFGRLVKRQGGRLLLLEGTDVVSVRFYHNLGEIWRGLSKSTYAAFDSFLPGLLLLLAVSFTIFIGPHILLYRGLQSGQTDLLPFGLFVMQIGLVWLGRLLMARRLRLDNWPCFLNGLMVSIVVLVALHSIIQSHLGSGPAWKGRVYSFDEGDLVHREQSK